MSLRTIFCILIFLIKIFCFPAYVSSKRRSCSPVETGPVCPHGYVETPSPRACVKVSPRSFKYSAAKTYCENLDPGHSSAFVSYNSEMTQQLKALMKPLGNTGRVYIGLTDLKTTHNWLWVNGQELRKFSKSWNPGEPNGAMYGEHCVVSTNEGNWADYFCHLELPILCMRRHQIGPREIEMSVKSHVPNMGRNIVYKGRDVTYTCSAFMQDDNYAFLKIRDNTGVDYPSSLYFDTGKNSLGMCTNKASIDITIKYPSASHRFECYARKLDSYDKNTVCQNQPNEFCKTFDLSITILDPPIKKPILKIHIDGKEARIECEVNVGITGKPSWVLYFKNSTTKVIPEYDLRIIDKSRDPDADNTARSVDRATLILDYDVMKGIRVGCFDHSIEKYSLNTACAADDLFCDIKILLPNDDTEAKFLGLGALAWLTILIIGVMIVGVLLFAVTRQKSEKIVIIQDAEVEQEQVYIEQEQVYIGQVHIYIGQEKEEIQASESIARASQVERSSQSSESITRASQVERSSRASESIARASQVQQSSQGGQRVSRV